MYTQWPWVSPKMAEVASFVEVVIKAGILGLLVGKWLQYEKWVELSYLQIRSDR